MKQPIARHVLYAGNHWCSNVICLIKIHLMRFELKDSKNRLSVTLDQGKYNDTTIAWNRNYLSTTISIGAGCFVGEYIAETMTFDYFKFRKEVVNLYDDPDGLANFNCLSEHLKLSIKGDGQGQFKAACIAIYEPGSEPVEVKFNIYIDQRQISALISQLDAILEKYPVIHEA